MKASEYPQDTDLFLSQHEPRNIFHSREPPASFESVQILNFFSSSMNADFGSPSVPQPQ